MQSNFVQNLKVERRQTFNDILEIQRNGTNYIVSTPQIEELIRSGEISVDIWCQGKGIVGTANYSHRNNNVFFNIGSEHFYINAQIILNVINPKKPKTKEHPVNTKNHDSPLFQSQKQVINEFPTTSQKRLSATETIFVNPNPQHTRGQPIIFSLGTYYPQHDKLHHNSFSREILNLKSKYCTTQPKKEAIRKFTQEMRSLLRKDQEYVICVMPSSSRGINTSGLREIAINLAFPPVIDGSNVMRRVYDIQPKHLGGPRNPQLERESLRVNNPDLIRDHIILLLDDVTTSGNSLMAGKEVLLNAYAADVVLFALGKTYRKNTSGE